MIEAKNNIIKCKCYTKRSLPPSPKGEGWGEVNRLGFGFI